jgi:uncharacterized damage-inducible protein DinB
MTLTEFFLEQLERQAESSRKALMQVPEGRNDWKPHERSMELGYLAALVASMPGWVAMMIEYDSVDLDTKDRTLRTEAVETRAELLALLEQGLEKSRRALQNTTDEHLMTNWSIRGYGHVLSEGPRYVNIQDGALSHLAHHRGQLTVYLRLLDAKVPAIYGPSADEPV